jgi:hypothetical protein
LPLLVEVPRLVLQVWLHQVVLQLAAAVTLLYQQALELPQELHDQLQYHWWCQLYLWMVLLLLLTHRSAQYL